MYMFQGGTNFGFMNGANHIAPDYPTYAADVTSYGEYISSTPTKYKLYRNSSEQFLQVLIA